MRSAKFVARLAVATLTVLMLVATVAPAQSATLRTWQRLANCESGGRWHINTGNGYYGGLQFSRSTWRGYGGGRYASTANRATKAEQIRIGERVKRAQGWGAWPVCSRRIGVR
jgi:hypothetical protein